MQSSTNYVKTRLKSREVRQSSCVMMMKSSLSRLFLENDEGMQVGNSTVLGMGNFYDFSYFFFTPSGIPEYFLGVRFDNPNKISSFSRQIVNFQLCAIKIDSKKCFQFDNLHQSVFEVKANGFVSVTIAIRSDKHAA